MQLNVKASKAFKKFKKSEKPAFGANVINGLDNSIFADPPVAITELLSLNTNLSTLLANALTGNHAAIAAVKPAVAEWNNAFGRTADYVSIVAEGDMETIRLGGFIPTKSETTPAQKPGAVENFIATINGSRGAIVTGSKYAVAGADTYIFSVAPEGVEITYSGDTTVITVGETSVYLRASKSKTTEFYDLPSHTPFNVSMYAVNSAGSGPATASKQVTTQ